MHGHCCYCNIKFGHYCVRVLLQKWFLVPNCKYKEYCFQTYMPHLLFTECVYGWRGACEHVATGVNRPIYKKKLCLLMSEFLSLLPTQELALIVTMLSSLRDYLGSCVRRGSLVYLITCWTWSDVVTVQNAVDFAHIHALWTL